MPYDFWGGEPPIHSNETPFVDDLHAFICEWAIRLSMFARLPDVSASASAIAAKAAELVYDAEEAYLGGPATFAAFRESTGERGRMIFDALADCVCPPEPELKGQVLADAARRVFAT